MAFRYARLAALALLGVGCASQNAQPQAPVQDGAVVISDRGSAQAVPYAPAGTAFNARLDQPIDTQISNPGDAVTATLIEPIRASNGQVLIDAGTQIHGKVAAIDRSNGAQIQLQFDSLALANGAVPLGVRVVTAPESRYESTPVPSGVTNTQPAPSGPSQAQTAPQPTVQVTMAKGAVLRLALTRPIVNAQSMSK